MQNVRETGRLHPKQTFSVCGGLGDDGFRRGVEDLREAFCDMQHETALVALAPMRNGGHVGSVRF